MRNGIDAFNAGHSVKPDEQYEIIEKLIGPPYIEIFSRRERAGWGQFGDQVVPFKL